MGNIVFKNGDIFDTDVEALVNPVNCFGFSLDGLADTFKKKYPNNYQKYKKDCSSKILTVGWVFVVKEPDNIIINFPTVKKNIFFKSKLEYISSGLDAMVKVIKDKKIKSVAIPALGCGIGGLKWDDVREIMIEKLESVENCEFYIFRPYLKE